MRRPRPPRDAGFSLVELVVASALISLVVIVVVSILISASTAERSVRTVTSATSAGQLVMRSLNDGITNAATPLSITASGSDQLILARTASKGSVIAWTCTAWYYSSADRTIRYKSSSSAIGAVTVASQRTWELLADGVRPVGTTPVFGLSGATGAVVTFTVDAGSSKPVAFATTITSSTSVAGSTPCY